MLLRTFRQFFTIYGCFFVLFFIGYFLWFVTWNMKRLLYCPVIPYYGRFFQIFLYFEYNALANRKPLLLSNFIFILGLVYLYCFDRIRFYGLYLFCIFFLIYTLKRLKGAHFIYKILIFYLLACLTVTFSIALAYLFNLMAIYFGW